MRFVIYDGDCGFCNKNIMLIARNDKGNNFKFVSNLSDFGENLLKNFQIEGLEQSTIILIEQRNYYTKSLAIKKILLKIPYFKILGCLMFLIPQKVSNWFYDFISKRRNRIVKNNVCKIPTLEVRKKFII